MINDSNTLKKLILYKKKHLNVKVTVTETVMATLKKIILVKTFKCTYTFKCFFLKDHFFSKSLCRYRHLPDLSSLTRGSLVQQSLALAQEVGSRRSLNLGMTRTAMSAVADLFSRSSEIGQSTTTRGYRYGSVLIQFFIADS